MPNRILRDGILTSERVNSLAWPAEVFYRRLHSVADDFGRYYAKPELLRAACYPLQLDKVGNLDIAKWLGETRKAGLVKTYTLDGKAYLELRDFRQRVRADVSKFPAPDGAPLTNDRTTPSSAGLDVDVDVDVDVKTPSAHADGAFTVFWQAYPRKTARKKALEAFKRSRVENGLLDTVLASIEAHKATEQWQRGVIPHASTWLNQRRWEDELASLPSLGECTWNVHGNREPGQPKCSRPAIVEKQGLVYCKAHGGRA